LTDVKNGLSVLKFLAISETKAGVGVAGHKQQQEWLKGAFAFNPMVVSQGVKDGSVPATLHPVEMVDEMDAKVAILKGAYSMLLEQDRQLEEMVLAETLVCPILVLVMHSSTSMAVGAHHRAQEHAPKARRILEAFLKTGSIHPQ